MSRESRETNGDLPLKNPAQQDTVFLLTLVDFLFQIIFFGFFAYAVSVGMTNDDWKPTALALEEKFAGQAPDAVTAAVAAIPTDLSKIKEAFDNAAQAKRIQEHFGVSNITELTDELTKMAPLQELKSANNLIHKAGTVDRANDAVTKYLKSGIGKPACLPTDGKSGKSRFLATVLGFEDRLEFVAETRELTDVLAKMNVSYSAVQSMPLAQFKKTFSQLGSLYPECMYTFDLVEKTRFVEPRDAATANWNVRVIPRKG